jgi:hypothetical protein
MSTFRQERDMATTYVGVRIQGGLLPAEVLSRLTAGDAALGGLGSGDYHLAAHESVREAANRSWAYLTGVWTAYRAALSELPGADWATTLTRERWLSILLNELGYGRVPLTGAGGIQVDDKQFAISHHWEHVPIHLLGARVPLDKRTAGLPGAATSSPQSMLQELLNRSEDRLWGILSNGNTLRLLRDSTALVGSAYVEFDLEAIFGGDLFSDFVLLYALCHQSRIEIRNPGEESTPHDCWLEQWRQSAVDSGSRALELLRDGVVEALNELGTGFLAHPANTRLREQVAERTLSLDDLNHALLRLVYRLLFAFVAEDRGVLLSPNAPAEARERYLKYFSTERLRRVARRRRGGRHGDLWRALTLVWRGLGTAEGRPELGIAPIGGIFEPGELDVLDDCELSNQTLLTAVRLLSLMTEPRSGVKRIVDYRNLGAEELGSIYEALLEFVPRWDPSARKYSLGGAAGNTRKTTGSYYTPTSLIDALLDTALDPVLDRAAKAEDPEQAYLSLTVCDPACGSGHFLVAAARRIAKRVAALRSSDPEPPPEVVREAMSDVVSRCIYGVDLNPLAAELAKVSLWLETMDPGKPLAYLDAQIKVGNSLIGATPKLLADGIPDDAFKAIEGDEKAVVALLKKRNAQERGGAQGLFDEEAVVTSNLDLANGMRKVVSGRPLSLSDVQVRRKRLADLRDSADYRQQRITADAWCAAFVWEKSKAATTPVTHDVLLRLRRGEAVGQSTAAEIERLATQYRFFHWHLEFPHIFPTSGLASPNEQTGWYGGFDAVLGNPPWDQIQLDPQEFFAASAPEISSAPNFARRMRMISRLADVDPGLYEGYLAAKRANDGLKHFVHASKLFPLTSYGRLNLYSLFAEENRTLLAPRGRAGFIVPTGIATDSFNQYYFRDVMEKGSLLSLYDFENRKPLFADVDSRFKFTLLTLSGREHHEPRADFAFFAHDPTDLLRAGMRFELTRDEINLLNPNTGTCPIFRSRRDAEITLGIYRRMPVLVNESDPENGNPWGIKFMLMFMMNTDSHLFHTREELEDDGWVLNGNVFERILDGGGVSLMLPLYEAKMIHHYDTHWATYDVDGSTRLMTAEEKAAHVPPMPRYWVHESEVDKKLKGKWNNSWYLGWRDICRATDERTAIATLLPRVAVGNKIPLALADWPLSAVLCLQAAFSSFCFDYVARQKIGGTTMNFFIFVQLAVPSPTGFGVDGLALGRPIDAWIATHVDRLNGWPSSGVTRDALRAELDALMLHVYRVARDDADYILDTFPIVRSSDLKEFGEYRTKRLILEAYDAMAEAIITGVPYRSPFEEEVFA